MEGRAARDAGDAPGNTPLVGRREALQEIGRVLDAAERGYGFLALVGEPGAGKTRLLNELADAANARKLPFVAGRAAEFEQEMPFGAVVDALDYRLEEQAPALPPNALRLLGTVFPALSDPADPAQLAGGAASPDSQVARYQLHRTVRHLLEDLAEPDGLVLILDDLHWADDATIELLDHLVRHPPRARVLVAVAYRPAQATPRLAALVDAAGPQGVRITADPLTQSEVTEFLGPGVSRSRCESLFKASGGNPFYLEALSKMGDGTVPAGRGGAEPHGWEDGVASLTEVPPAVRAALQVELSALPPEALLMARGAAVAADVFEPALAAVAAELELDAALAALDVLTGHDVVRPAGGGRFRFRHPLVRHVAYASTAAGWRIAAHSRVAVRLAELGAPASVRAHHVVRSARFGDREAIGTLVEAARVVALQAPATAAYWLEAALELMPDTAEAGAGGAHPDRIELLVELAHVQAVSGHAEQGRETARTLLGLLPAEDTVRRARTVHLCAVMERQLGRITRRGRWCWTSCAASPTGRPPRRCCCGSAWSPTGSSGSTPAARTPSWTASPRAPPSGARGCARPWRRCGRWLPTGAARSRRPSATRSGPTSCSPPRPTTTSPTAWTASPGWCSPSRFSACTTARCGTPSGWCRSPARRARRSSWATCWPGSRGCWPCRAGWRRPPRSPTRPPPSAATCAPRRSWPTG
ncbi:hypothetical protein GCM10009546_48430 [Actinomadura livida]|uniref:Orc1-like AAA ATPase domain-containing protein n=1 Tax=Actinomadura livida TaxID=79909 RepID=A0ABN1F1W7_9ACTN